MRGGWGGGGRGGGGSVVGVGGGRGLLGPQDGILVVKLQLLHRSTPPLLSAAGLVLHHLEGLLHFSIPANKTRVHQHMCQPIFIKPRQHLCRLHRCRLDTYLRVSMCLEVAPREGNCVSLKISGGPWVGPRLLVVSLAPGGRYTPEGLDSGTSTSSAGGE